MLKCLYFITVTITTIGYGDVVPTKSGSKIFTIFVIFIGIFGVTGFMADFFGSSIKRAIDHIVTRYFKASDDDMYEDDPLAAPTHWQEKIGCVLAVLLLLVIIATVFLMLEHKIDFVTSLYWTIVSMTR